MANIQLGLGTANFFQSYGLVQLTKDNLNSVSTLEENSEAILTEALKCGVSYIDTAASYGGSETFIADFIKKHPSAESFKVISKFKLTDWQQSSAQSKHMLGASLSALLWHDFSEKLLEEQFDLLKRIKHYLEPVRMGCSTYGAGAARAAVNSGIFDLVEIEYNFLNPWSYNTVKELAASKNITLVLRSIFQRGFLTASYLKNPHQIVNNTQLMHQLLELGGKVLMISNHWGISPEELALRFVLTHAEKSVILLSAHNADVLKSNFSYCTRGPLPAACVQELENLTQGMNPDYFDLRLWS